MARKKKKKEILHRKQLKQQRRKAKVRKRRGHDQRLRWTPFAHPGDEVVQDMLPLFHAAGGSSASPISAIEELMVTILASEDLANEPEFEEIFIDPMTCVETFAEVGREMGMDLKSPDEFQEEEREEIQLQMLEESARRLLTDELRQDILNGLNGLRLRLKQSGKREEAARAALLQSFLSGKEVRESWQTIGLVQAIFQRSLEVGFELLEASEEVMESGDVEEGSISLMEKLAQSSLAQKADALLRKIPGVQGFLEKQMDKIWEEGVKAIYAGDLYLELYSQEELKGATKVFAAVTGYDGDKQIATENPSSADLSEEVVRTLVSRLDGYVTELFTSERFEQLRGRLDTILRDPAYRGKWLPFIFMLRDYMADEDAVENEKMFLISALLGEMRAVDEDSSEDDG